MLHHTAKTPKSPSPQNTSGHSHDGMHTPSTYASPTYSGGVMQMAKPIPAASKKKRQEVYGQAHASAQWGASTRTKDNLVIESWNTQGKHGRALDTFVNIHVPDILLAQEDGVPPAGGKHDKATGVTTGIRVVHQKQWGYDDTKPLNVHFAHVTTGSKNLAIYSIHPIDNPHLIRTGSPGTNAWHFRPILAAQVQGLPIQNMHLVSGAPALAEKHLEHAMDASAADDRDVFMAGDANMDETRFERATKRARYETESMVATEPTQKSGGHLDHGALIHKSIKKWPKGKIARRESKVLYAKGSDHKKRRFKLRFQNKRWKVDE